LRNHSRECQLFARRLKRLMREALKLQVDRDDLRKSPYNKRVSILHIQLADIFACSYRNKDRERLLKRLDKHSDELLVFLLHLYPNAQANNNHVEKQMGYAVLMCKNSYGDQSTRGAETQAILMSLFQTCQLRGMGPIAFFRSASPHPGVTEQQRPA
jgi:transposase